MTDSEIKKRGMQALLNELGELEAERFITLMNRDSFDYTVWQRNLWQSKTVSDISREAMDYRKNDQ